MNPLSVLAALAPWRTKANPAGEGNPHPGPYNILGQGWLPDAWGRNLNFWQMDYNPLPGPSSSIVEACVWAYARAIGQLPGYHKRDSGDGGNEIVTTSALSRLLRTPNDYMTSSDFLVHLIRSLLLTGNSYWVAERNSRSEVTALHWTDPRQCHPVQILVEGQSFREVFYQIGFNPLTGLFDRGNIAIPARDVFHIKLATPRHPLIGETWLASLQVEQATRSAITTTSSALASNMSRPSGVLSSDRELSGAQIQELRARWNEQAVGLNSGGVPILGWGLKFQPLSVSNADAQIIDMLKLTDQAIAAVFGVPMILLGVSNTATQKSSEAVMAEWLAAGLGWLINHIEVSFDAFIGLNDITAGREWTEYDTRALLRSAFKDRIDGLVSGVLGGLYAPNEARALEGLPAAVEGDEPRLQAQVVPLSAWNQPQPMPAAPSAPSAPSASTTANDNAAEQTPEEQKAFAAFLLERAMNHAAG
jgi:HK97 family phage portal protein